MARESGHVLFLNPTNPLPILFINFCSDFFLLTCQVLRDETLHAP